MNKKVILTADDWGACDFIDNGIEIALRNHKINAVNVFVTYPSSVDRINKLISLKNELAGQHEFSIGLHFSITAGSPVTGQHNSLTEIDGNGKIVFQGAGGFRFDANATELKTELRAQIKVLEHLLGGHDKIDHISNHHGVVYLDDRYFDAWIEVLKDIPIPVRSPLAWSQSELKPRRFGLNFPPPIALEGLSLGMWKRMGETLFKKQVRNRVNTSVINGLLSPYCTCDAFYGLPVLKNLETMMRNFADYQGICVEFMFHLGDPDIDLPRHNIGIAPDGINFDYFLKRQKELNVLLELDLQSVLSDLSFIKPFRSLAVNDWKLVK